MQKIILYLSVAANLIFVAFFIGKRYYYTHRPPAIAVVVPINDSLPDLYDSSHNTLYRQYHIDSGNIVFVGNSLTEGFPLNQLYHSTRIINMGIGANQSRHILARIEAIANQHPGKIFLEMGINDIGHKIAVDTIFAHYVKIIEVIRRLSPHTIVYVQSLTPTRHPMYPQIISLNKRLQEYSQNQKLTFIDLYSAFAKNGEMDSTLTYDGIHLISSAYLIWKKKIDPYVN